MEVLNGIEYAAPGAVTCAASGLTTVATITNAGFKRLCFQCDVATQATDDFEVSIRNHASGPWQVITPAWSSATYPLKRVLDARVCTNSSGAIADTDLDTLATTQNGAFELDITGVQAIKVEVSGASDGCVITPRWSLHS